MNGNVHDGENVKERCAICEVCDRGDGTRKIESGEKAVKGVDLLELCVVRHGFARRLRWW